MKDIFFFESRIIKFIILMYVWMCVDKNCPSTFFFFYISTIISPFDDFPKMKAAQFKATSFTPNHVQNIKTHRERFLNI